MNKLNKNPEKNKTTVKIDQQIGSIMGGSKVVAVRVDPESMKGVKLDVNVQVGDIEGSTFVGLVM